jgi:hypothetical protein
MPRGSRAALAPAAEDRFDRRSDRRSRWRGAAMDSGAPNATRIASCARSYDEARELRSLLRQRTDSTVGATEGRDGEAPRWTRGHRISRGSRAALAPAAEDRFIRRSDRRSRWRGAAMDSGTPDLARIASCARSYDEARELRSLPRQRTDTSVGATEGRDGEAPRWARARRTPRGSRAALVLRRSSRAALAPATKLAGCARSCGRGPIHP